MTGDAIIEREIFLEMVVHRTGHTDDIAGRDGGTDEV